MGRSRQRESADLERRLESPEALDLLLAQAGSPWSFEEVVDAMRQGAAEGHSSGEVIPSLFDGEPRFSEPALAPRLFGNLLGLWDVLAQGKPLPTRKIPPPPRPP